MGEKIKNKTIILSESYVEEYSGRCIISPSLCNVHDFSFENNIVHNDTFRVLPWIANECFDLIIIDPPYNLDKTFNQISFKKMKLQGYLEYLNSFLKDCARILKPTGSLYLCGDWKSSAAMQMALTHNNLHIQNRLTWSRDKGRGAKTNYKNNMEDIWFATKHPTKYTFNVDAIKLKKKVIAPYKDADGNNKDWEKTEDGKKWRLTYPSNIIYDCTIPFWSMEENTEHPTQKPEKLIAKLILASSNEGELVFDPFVGSGTTAVVSYKLGRRFCGIEIDRTYCALTQYRLEKAQENQRIQGYDTTEKCFLERNYNDKRA